MTVVLSFSLFSCKNENFMSDPQQEVKNKVKNYEQVLCYANSVLLNGDSLEYLVNYKFPNSINGLRSYSKSPTKNLVYDFIADRNLNEETLLNYLSDNPDNLIEFVSYTTSKEFSSYYKKLLTVGYSDVIADEIYNSDILTNLEKSYLFLLVSYDKYQSQGLRSFWGCVKRYAKLTAIAVTSLRISLLDSQSGTEYATRELKEMKGKYDDC